MDIVIGLLIIAIGAFCQSSCYVPINKIKQWSWESYWIVQGVFAWLVFPFLGALLAVPEGHSLGELFAGARGLDIAMTMLFSRFVMGMPVVGVAGGLYNPVIISQLHQLAEIKYEIRLLERCKTDLVRQHQKRKGEMN